MPRNLQNLLGPFFSPTVQARGAAYARGGRVDLKDWSDEFMDADVHGSRHYRVRIDAPGEEATLSCTCPYRAGGDLCKHLWAVLVTADRKEIWADREKLTWLESDGVLNDDDGYPETVPTPKALPHPEVTPQTPGHPPAHWKNRLSLEVEPALRKRKGEFHLYYTVPYEASLEFTDGLILNLRQAKPTPEGARSTLREIRAGHVPDDLSLTPNDHEVLALLWGTTAFLDYGYSNNGTFRAGKFILTPAAARILLPRACAEGRCLLELEGRPDGEWPTLTWDGGDPWAVDLSLSKAPQGGACRLTATLRRGAETKPAVEAIPFQGAGLVLIGSSFSPLADARDGRWLVGLSGPETIVPKSDIPEFLTQYYRRSHSPPLSLPPEFKVRTESRLPQPVLRVHPPNPKDDPRFVHADLSFDYGGILVPEAHEGTRVYKAGDHLLLERALPFEDGCAAKLSELGFPVRQTWYRTGRAGKTGTLSGAVTALAPEGWRVEADGRRYRGSGSIQGGVSSGRDWFDLSLSATFDGVKADVPSLLTALRKGDRQVRLDDGTFGILPEEWLARYSLAARLGAPGKDALRFTTGQSGLLDALLSERPEVRLDKVFLKAREKLSGFNKPRPSDPARTFHGKLRPYQREGLGWLHYLREFGFGGCLADDMGLGKTIQVLALLGLRRASEKKGSSKRKLHPSLVVVPKSLVFNWKQEAARFAPNLRLLDHTGAQRLPPGTHFNDYDLVLTTYGTLRRDVAHFTQTNFDYAILDEAHAIKNPASANAKAARLLKASHRLALTGTPIQNNLDEIWSLFEYLNPGLLGALPALVTASQAEDRVLLARALKPFLLRRTKENVAKDLPAKTDQVLLCALQGSQKTLYESLRDHYRDSLLRKVDKEGLGKTRMHVLEALLRLRQAACHPGLIDRAKSGETGSKLEALIPSLGEVLAGGHKALVFSQFTSFLDIVRTHLEPKKWPYAYLDGRTSKREEQVRRFQEDKDCGLFLISLKAGGLGLNLTEAEYVYILDPWWNPAVEAQAIDRAHRIGQKRKVSAYRLITQGTVEEKILEMQKEKRKLAQSILEPEGGLLGGLTRDDIENLLS